MPDQPIFALISAYLQSYANASCDPPPELVAVLRQQPASAFEVIAAGSYTLPSNLDFRDVDDPLYRLLITFVDLVPDALIVKMTSGFWATRWLYIGAAAGSRSLRFIPHILDQLSDRSPMIQSLVLQLILQWPHLRTPAALPRLEQLRQSKAYLNDKIDPGLLEQAIQCVSQHKIDQDFPPP